MNDYAISLLVGLKGAVEGRQFVETVLKEKHGSERRYWRRKLAWWNRSITEWLTWLNAEATQQD